MTLALGVVFLAAARWVMAYTLTLDLVPIIAPVVLVALLIAVVQTGKIYGERRLCSAFEQRATAMADRPGQAIEARRSVG